MSESTYPSLPPATTNFHQICLRYGRGALQLGRNGGNERGRNSNKIKAQHGERAGRRGTEEEEQTRLVARKWATPMNTDCALFFLTRSLQTKESPRKTEREKTLFPFSLSFLPKVAASLLSMKRSRLWGGREGAYDLFSATAEKPPF